MVSLTVHGRLELSLHLCFCRLVQLDSLDQLLSILSFHVRPHIVGVKALKSDLLLRQGFVEASR